MSMRTASDTSLTVLLMLLWVSSGVRSRIIRLIIIGFGCKPSTMRGKSSRTMYRFSCG